MKNYFLTVLLLSFSLSITAQTNDYETIAFLTNRGEIPIKTKLIKVEEDTFLKIIIDSAILPDEVRFIENEVTLTFETDNKDSYFNSYYFVSLNFDAENALFLLDEEQLKFLKENPIKTIKIDYLNGTEYTFKNIVNPTFFQNKI